MTATTELAGRVVLVTGASSGIGEHVALAFAAKGASVVLAARRAERLRDLAARIQRDGGTALALPIDVTDAAQLERALARIAKDFGRLDVLVNSAGILQSARIAEADPLDWRDMIDANLLGLMLATRAALPLLKAGGGGHVFNISSISARLANPGSPCYAATKAAVSAFSETLRKDVAAQNVRVTDIVPGLVETEALDKIKDPATKERFAAMASKIAALQPQDIANVIVFAHLQPAHVCLGEIVIRPTAMPD